MSNIPKEYKTAEGLRTLANYLRSTNGIKVRSGIEHEKRVDYFKGKRLIECVLEAKKWPKSLPKITDKGVANIVAGMLVQSQFFHRSEKVEDKKGYLKISQRNVFEESGIYTWMYAGNLMWSNIATGLVIAVVIGFTLLPIWPNAAKHVLWYMSVTFLISTLAFCLIRFLAFLLCWIVGYDFWIFPRLFDESLSFQDSFKPIYTFEPAAKGQGWYRLGMLLALSGFVYWACTQPTEFDGLLKVQKDFIDDLYSGKLLADVAHDPKLNTGDRSRKMPSLEDLIRDLERDNIADTAHADSATDESGNGNMTAATGADSSSGFDDIDADVVQPPTYVKFDADGNTVELDEDEQMDARAAAAEAAEQEAQEEQDRKDEEKLQELLERDE